MGKPKKVDRPVCQTVRKKEFMEGTSPFLSRRGLLPRECHRRDASRPGCSSWARRRNQVRCQTLRKLGGWVRVARFPGLAGLAGSVAQA
jgi:hypothetical protein